MLSLNNDNDNIIFSSIDKYSNKIKKSKRIYMNWEEVKEISNSSLFEIGAHSISHPDLTKISKTYKEIAHSKKIIENKINKNVNLFAYPYGTKTYKFIRYF